MKIVLKMAAVAAMIALVCAVPSVAQSDSSEYVIVANKDLPGGVIKIDALKVVFERAAKTWKNTRAEIVPVDLYTADGFYQNLFGKSYTQMQKQWVKMRSDYSMDMPVFKMDPEDVKQFIAGNRNAIGFLKASDVDERVKVIKLVE